MRLKVFFAVFWAFLVSGCAAQTNFAPAPENTAQEVLVFSSTRQINGFAQHGETVWAATAGGVLRRDANGWRKSTRADGLPSHEIRRIEIQNGIARVITPRGTAVFEDERWKISETNEQAAPPVLWRGQKVSGTHELKIGEGKAARVVALRAGRGSHLGALLPQKNELWAALYGDGVWRYDGARWEKANWNVPEVAREITALAGRENDVWLGTRRDGAWHFDGKIWTQSLESNEPFDSNIQNMAAFGGALWCSSLEDGLMRFDGRKWNQIAPPEVSSNAPRQMAVFAGALYLRHGNGAVDSFDGATWKRDVFQSLPRRKTFALASDKQKIYAAQWGGWSEWDGKTWTHFLREPELQGVIVLALLPDGDDLWIGTQNKGIGHWNRATNKLTWHDERVGLPDDWITTLAKQGDEIIAGTFVGGVAIQNKNGRWNDVAALRGQNVTALEPDGTGGLYVATRTGLWHRAANGELENINARFGLLDSELQSLCAGKDGVWVGARTGIFWMPQK